MTRDVHRCVTVDYQQIVDGNIANQIHGFTIDYGKFILILFTVIRNLSTMCNPGVELTDHWRPSDPCLPQTSAV